ncbi:hypothetical protein C7Y47_11465 [Lysinibacillus sphaericus]|uniref:DUF2513 domain-containing protein n=1 Tax=Lysinibacillus sphaericus TaxID=1421 RepID=A0A544UI79_LYSSH|nr:hypothetical protein [Lysinibacillus sp. SDF0037]TQR32742.1 hypothetical protein C7Y47_11465 [Lysinibacillus sp. SDF0037]
MIDVNAMKERKKIRLEILEQLYNLHFVAPTQNNCLISKINELYGERNSEKHLAYHYLVTSGYINIDNMDDSVAVSITATGIDYVESYYEKKKDLKAQVLKMNCTPSSRQWK